VDVDESRPKRSLADDPDFLATLSDLDRGLRGGARPPEPEAPPRVDPTVPPSTAPTRPVSAVPPATAAPSSGPLFAASDLVPDAPVSHYRARRPLLDLFPPAPFVGERPPGPAPGTAIGPRLSSKRVAREIAPSRAAGLSYETFYGLAEKPFGVSADPRFLYRSAAHDRVAQALLAAIRAREGFAIVTGEVGLGKTMLCGAVIEQLDRRTLTSFRRDPFVSVDDVLNTILVDFGVISREDLAYRPQTSRQELENTLRSFLASLASLRATAVILVDEAQGLPIEVLQEIHRLAGDEGDQQLQLVMIGQPNLLSILARPELRSLNRRIAVRCELGPLGADEIPGYVMHRMGVAGSSRVEFDDGALRRLYECSRGVPRIVNLLCDRALGHAYEASARVIDTALIDRAADALDLTSPVRGRSRLLRGVLSVCMLVALALIGGALAVWVFRDEVQRTIVQWEAIPPLPGAPIPRLPAPLGPIPPP
jgi:type II secretory pathway predicted ATPase ExeA